MCHRSCVVVLTAIVTLAMCLSTSHGYYQLGNTLFGPSRCPLPSSPCRLRVVMRTFTGDLVHSSTAHTCTCNSPYSCTDDWTPGDQVVSRSLISTTFNMTLSMKFCAPVQPKRVCNNGEAALTVSGYLDIPNDLESYNCHCDDGVPLQLHERRIANYRYYHTYVCGNHKATCSGASTSCMTIGEESTQYHCKCPGRSQCETSTEWTPFTGELNGRCQP